MLFFSRSGREKEGEKEKRNVNGGRGQVCRNGRGNSRGPTWLPMPDTASMNLFCNLMIKELALCFTWCGLRV